MVEKIDHLGQKIPSNTKLKEQIYELSKVYHIPPWIHKGEEVISFSPNELAGNRAMREQSLVITGIIDNCESERLLIDSGAAKDVLYYRTFKEMELSDSMLAPYNGRLIGFTNHKAEAKGTVDLVLEVGEYPYKTSTTITFIIMDLASDYHAILGSPSQGKLGMVASLPHQRVKFPTPEGIGCVLGNPKHFLEHVMKSRKAKTRMEIDTPERNITISKSTTVTTSTPHIGVITVDMPEEWVVLDDDAMAETEVIDGLDWYGSISMNAASNEPSDSSLDLVPSSGAAIPTHVEAEIDRLLDMENMSLDGKV